MVKHKKESVINSVINFTTDANNFIRLHFISSLITAFPEMEINILELIHSIRSEECQNFLIIYVKKYFLYSILLTNKK